MKIQNLTVCYEQLTILQNFTLELPDEGRICFFAPSGTGKTTLLRAIAGLIPIESGSMEGIKEKKLAFVFQEDRLIPSLTAKDNIGVVLNKENQHLAEKYLAGLGLSGWENAFPNELSGGMKRRVALARALAYGEQNAGHTVYFMDEPLKGLDGETAKQVMCFLRRKLNGSLAFFITHDMNEAKNLADIIFCFEGHPMQIKKVIDQR